MIATISCVIFTLDRPMQLDATLKSLRRHVGDRYSSVTILYRSSTNRFASGYDAVRDEHPAVRWVAERDFRVDLLSLLDATGYIVFHTDDDVFFEEVGPLVLHDDEVCFSLRLGLNIRYSYSFDLPELLALPHVARDRISWDWRAQGRGSFSYPLALNGHVFRADEFRKLAESLRFHDPNELESGLHERRDTVRPRMAAFPTSRVVSIPANVVTRRFRNRHAGMLTAADLNERFLAGERIVTESMAFNAVSSCHQEIPFAFSASTEAC